MADHVAPAGYSHKDYLRKPYKLLRQGADATIIDEDGNGAFHYLVQSDMFKEPDSPEEFTFGRPLRPPSPVDDPSMTMEGLIHNLQAAGADINLQNKNGETPLHLLFKNADPEEALDEMLCESLCQAGANLNIQDRQGRSAVFFLFLAESQKEDYIRKNKGDYPCQLVSRLGGRFDVQDNRGQTLIHYLFCDGGLDLPLVEALARHGVDPSAVDDEGNTLWHVALELLDGPVEGNKQLFDLLLRLGADPQKPNKLGRNALHGLSSCEAPYLGGLMTIFPACVPDMRTTAFDYLLHVYLEASYELDTRDNQGITPLHLTCTFSEYQAGRLLEAGADPRIPTHEGLTSLHLAARCGQANIIGLLLEKVKTHESGLEGRSSSSIHEVINAKDVCGRSPLYYACASGRAESVALLLDAGASVQSDEYSGSIWQACADFEEEKLNWSEYSFSATYNKRMTASSVLIEGKTRPLPKRDNTFPRQHLGDVLRLLLQHQHTPGAIISYLNEAISAAAAKNHDYTVWCLVDARNSMAPGATTVTMDELTAACLARVNAIGISEDANLSPQDLRAEFERLMGLRRHDLVKSLLLKHGWGELNYDGNTFIHDLVLNGFVSLLREVTGLVKDLSAKLEDPGWCDAQKLASSRGTGINRFPEYIYQNFAQGSTQPLLLVACRSEEPNFEMVKFLVEEIGCGIDTQGYVRVYIPDSPTGFGICKHETPIHVLARGRTTWWQISEALPYLVRDRGANLEVRDCFHSTPLAVAVSHVGRVTFNRGAVDTLLDLGTDAKAADMRWTCESPEITDILLSRGAVVKPAAILAAVRSRNCAVLDMLLSRGGDVNTRETAVPHHRNTPIYIEMTAPPRERMPPISEVPKHLRLGVGPEVEPAPPPPTPKDPEAWTPWTIPAPPYIPEQQMYPLDYAAHLMSRQPGLDDLARGRYPEEYRPRPRPLPADELARVIETLVAHGADVMAAYELADGSRMSIRDRIVLRGRDCGIRPLGRPQRARRILELCQTTFEVEL